MLTLPRKAAQRRARRQYLRNTLCVDAGIVAATPDNELEQLVWDNRYHQLQLVPDVQAPNALQRLFDECAAGEVEPDEVASILTFTSGRHVEPHEIGDFFPGGSAA